MTSEVVKLEHRLQNIKEKAKAEGRRAVLVAEFLGAVGADSYYRGYLAKNGKTMPQIAGFDADNVVGALAVGAAFFELLPEGYVDHAMAIGSGLLAGSVANQAAGFANPDMKPARQASVVKGATAAHGVGALPQGSASSAQGARIIDMVRGIRR
jgi:hypothetical protein